jgi:tyrosyl-tRNA synthetase
MILQGYDFRHLCQNMDVRLQMGGSDQWGNIVNGVELSRRMDGAEVFGLTTPLITKSDGTKMGKSVSGAIWLNEAQLPAYDYWQFWRNSDDSDVGKFLRLFTDLPLDEIARLEALQGAEINDAKIVLANEATRLCRGEDAAKAAAETARQTFAEGGTGADLPRFEVSGGSIDILDALVGLSFCASRGEAKRKIAEGAVKVDDSIVSAADAVVAVSGDTKISLGKKRHGLLVNAA